MRRLVVLVLVLIVTGCSTDAPPEQSNGSESSPVPDGSPTSGAPGSVRTLVDGLETPWGIAFLPDGTAIVTERDTRRVLAVRDGEATAVGLIEPATPNGEAGLLGVAVSPEFESDSLLYFYFTTADDNRIVRTRLENGRLGELEVILDGIPSGFIHDGGRLAFGPDGYLYVSTGEIGEPELAQDPDSLGGKILRITAEGRPAPGNPEPASPVWSMGHRNVQGLAFDEQGRLWASEFGANRFDELNLIEAGSNYGWPAVEGQGDDDRYVNPHLTWSTAEASPSGLAYADGQLWMASLRGERLWRIDVEDGRAVEPKAFFVGEYGRMRTVAFAPDGSLWVTTSNRDGRGDPQEGDDRILVVSVEEG